MKNLIYKTYYMCYNKEVSLTTYIAGIIGCINLYFNFNLKVEAIFFWICYSDAINRICYMG